MKKHFYWLDLIRFIAAFVVVISHCSMTFFTNYEELDNAYHTTSGAIIYLMLRSGAEAVTIFFVLSGFLVGGIAIQRIRDGSFDLKSYMIDRSVRILLPLISALILTYFVNELISESYTMIDYVGNLFSLQNIFVSPVNGVLWSLSYEVWFYIVMAGVALVLTNINSGNKTIIVFGFLIILVCFMVFTKLSATALFLWLIGALAFLIIPARPHSKVILFSGILLLISWFYIKQTYRGELISGLPTPSRAIIELMFAASFAVLMINIINIIPSKRIGIRVNKIGTKLATFSYTLYLIHYPILSLLKHLGIPVSNRQDWQSIMLVLGISLFCLIPAYLIYCIAEKHSSVVKSYFKRKML